MGCDIHAHFEIKVKNKWLHYDKPNLERNYQLFGKMAGVRGDEKPIVLPRGLPDNISDVTELESKWQEGDAHTHSWFNAKEIKEIIEFHEGLFDADVQYKISLGQWFSLDGNGWDNFNEFR